MDASSQKKIASELMKCGTSRVRITQSEEVEDALTREDIRGLIQKGLISKVQKKGTSKFASKRKLVQKGKGRMRGPGRRKGTKGARKNDKTKWIEKVRPLRRLLSEMRQSGQISTQDYRMLYMRVKGGFFRNRNHLLYFMKEHDILSDKISKRDARKALRKGRAAAKPSAKSPRKRQAGNAAKKTPGKKQAGKPKKTARGKR